jgi:hypothetical protein
LPGENTLDYVKQLFQHENLDIDEGYGLVVISPKRNLFTIRVFGDIDAKKLQNRQPKIDGIYGDVRIAPIK